VNPPIVKLFAFVVNVPLMLRILPVTEHVPEKVAQLSELIVNEEAKVSIIQPVIGFDGVKVNVKLLLVNNVGEENIPDNDKKFDA
jgi:hypothetical protein